MCQPPGRREQEALRRQELTATTFVEIVDSLVNNFDVIEVLTILTSRTVELLSASAAGVLLTDEVGRLRVMAASTEQIQLLELFQLQNDEGPCLDCFRSGAVIAEAHLDRSGQWPRFAAESVAAGYPSVCAIPLRLKERVLGCLNLFMATTVSLPPTDITLARALADVASIAVVQDQATRLRGNPGRSPARPHQPIAIEQAKGMIAEYTQIDMDQAFGRAAACACPQPQPRARGTSVAEAVVQGRRLVDRCGGGPTPATNPACTATFLNLRVRVVARYRRCFSFG